MISWLPNDWPLNTRYQIKRIQSVATKTGAPSPPTKSPGKQLHYSADFISTTCGADSTESCAIADCRLSIVMANYVRRLRTRRDAAGAAILQCFYKSNYREWSVLLEMCALRQFQLWFICVLLKNVKSVKSTTRAKISLVVPNDSSRWSSWSSRPVRSGSLLNPGSSFEPKYVFYRASAKITELSRRMIWVTWRKKI